MIILVGLQIIFLYVCVYGVVQRFKAGRDWECQMFPTLFFLFGEASERFNINELSRKFCVIYLPSLIICVIIVKTLDIYTKLDAQH